MRVYRDTLEDIDGFIYKRHPYAFPLLLIWLCVGWIFILLALLENKLDPDEHLK